MKYVYGIMHIQGNKQYRGATLFSTWELAYAFAAQLQKDDDEAGIPGTWLAIKIEVHGK